MTSTRLPLDDMAKRHTGLTPEIAAVYHQAACVCLDRHHTPPTEFNVQKGNRRDLRVRVEWAVTDERARNAWSNSIDATEAAAYAVALAATELMDGLVAIRRAETGTGADYYVGTAGTSADDLEACLRLEVSGVDKGPVSVVAQRLREKLDQTRYGNSNLPAMAGVVGFKAKLVMLEHVGVP